MMNSFALNKLKYWVMFKFTSRIKSKFFITFSILFLSYLNLNAATCSYELIISDDYGDGWDGEVKIQKNCGSGWVDVIGWQSETGYGPTTISFTVDDADGCSYRLRYRDNGGIYPFEEFFDLYDSNGTRIIDGDGSDASIQNIPFTPNCSAPTCSDGIQNQGETGIDCGGPCAACPPSCTDGIQNQGETGIDCGGPCSPCAVVSSCAALGFDDVASSYTGTHSVWTTMSGRNNVAGPFTIEGPIANVSIINSQFNEFCDLRPGNDPSAGFCYFPDGTIPVPNGSQTVMRLGAYQQIGMDAAGMRTTFTVTEPYLVYYYILGFENSGHTVNNRGFCTFEIRDNGGVVLPCGSFQVYENGPNENWSFHTTSNDVWLMDDWRTVTLDVSSYIGQDLTIEVWVADCQEGAHSGFGYFDFECLSAATPDCSVSPSPLPVEFHNLSANCNHNRASLTWTTLSERDNSHFTVWESSDGVNFSAIGDVIGMGTTSSSHNYSFEIANYTNETKYYRVSQTDLNGNETIHETVAFSGCHDSEVNVHYADGFVSVSGTDIYQVTVVDAAGRRVKESNSIETNQKIAIEHLDGGIYFVVVYQKGKNPKIVKIFNN